LEEGSALIEAILVNLNLIRCLTNYKHSVAQLENEKTLKSCLFTETRRVLSKGFSVQVFPNTPTLTITTILKHLLAHPFVFERPGAQWHCHRATASLARGRDSATHTRIYSIPF
jgi:hypothetical protein